MYVSATCKYHGNWLSCVRVPLLTVGKTMQCMLWRLMLPHKVYRHFTGRECSNMVRLAKWRNQQTLQKYLMIDEQPTICSNIYHFHSAPVPPTWLLKKRESSSISTRMGSRSERHSRYITSSHPSKFFRKAYLCCQGQNSRCTLGATFG